MFCFEVTAGKAGEKEILCDKPCMSLRACGRHQCRRVCCPLASLAHVQGVGKKGKRKANAGEDANPSGTEGSDQSDEDVVDAEVIDDEDEKK